ncbi:VPLPA-CTERM sorting domain-containing protein [uncultured Thiocystis sp.]|uniref:VPLPA-CTERM sorting domain-containing protein n=1 Tax=uncultured Thiocystis sp. TaxID=1202134 RepID=UPI0025F2EC5A|nr:VPLPA-CTERM sorting domain-containing protein [uncultured Thiocystis sp.]
MKELTEIFTIFPIFSLGVFTMTIENHNVRNRSAKSLAMAALLFSGLALPISSVFATTYNPNQAYEDPKNDPFSGDLNGSPSLAKFEFNGKKWEDGNSDGNYISAFTVTATETKTEGGKTEWIAGTWSFDPSKVTGISSSDVLFPTKIAVKSKDWFFFEVTAGTTSGTWSTKEYLGGKGLSHISFYDTGTPVPLPAAAWLFGSALMGVAGIGYRRKSQEA